MAVERTEPLPDRPGFVEYHDDGRIICKNPDGVIIKHPLNYSPPEAMEPIRAGHNRRQSKPVLAEVDDLLKVLPAELLADEREAWIIKHLAAALVVGGAGSSSIARELVQRLGLPSSQTMKRPEEGEMCPTCKRVYWKRQRLSPEVIHDMIGDMQAFRARRKEEGAPRSP